MGKERHRSGYKPLHQEKKKCKMFKVRGKFLDYSGQNVNIYGSLRAMYLTIVIKLG